MGLDADKGHGGAAAIVRVKLTARLRVRNKG